MAPLEGELDGDAQKALLKYNPSLATQSNAGVEMAISPAKEVWIQL